MLGLIIAVKNIFCLLGKSSEILTILTNKTFLMGKWEKQLDFESSRILFKFSWSFKSARLSRLWQEYSSKEKILQARLFERGLNLTQG